MVLLSIPAKAIVCLWWVHSLQKSFSCKDKSPMNQDDLKSQTSWLFDEQYKPKCRTKNLVGWSWGNFYGWMNFWRMERQQRYGDYICTSANNESRSCVSWDVAGASPIPIVVRGNVLVHPDSNMYHTKSVVGHTVTNVFLVVPADCNNYTWQHRLILMW